MTPNQKRALRRLWKGELSDAEIADELGISADELQEAAAFLGLPEREDSDVYLPTREEIRIACAEIRSKWTQAEREARRASAWSGRLIETTGLDTHARRRSSRDRSEGGAADGSSR